ncbi:MAG: RHS repeat-associated core domain-containing protein [Flavobacteriaceae bacterium]|nr:RHS repeat-associated core domain-containing protein [Flavobacteriaceae bacterium]
MVKGEYKYKFNDYGEKSFEKAFYEHTARSAEWQDELGLNVTAMDYRNYDMAIGRFMNPDALSEISMSWSPYRFAFDNPVFWSDPTGLYEEDCSYCPENSSEFKPLDEDITKFYYDPEKNSIDEIVVLNGTHAMGKKKDDYNNERNKVFESKEHETGFDAYDGGEFGSQLASINKSNQARIKHNSKGWTDAKGNWRNITEIQKNAKGKYVRGVQGIRNSKNIAEVTSKNLSKVAKRWGVVETTISFAEGMSDGNFTIGDATQTAITLISTFGGPIGWGYEIIDLGVGLSSGKDITERIEEAIDEQTGGTGIEF